MSNPIDTLKDVKDAIDQAETINHKKGTDLFKRFVYGNHHPLLAEFCGGTQGLCVRGQAAVF